MNDFISIVDSKFADIQRFVNERKDLDEETKENMISLCIECNDMIARIHSTMLIRKSFVEYKLWEDKHDKTR